MSRTAIFTTFMAVALSAVATGTASSPAAARMDAVDNLDGETRTLIAYFSAQGTTKGVAEAIQRETGADIFFIEPADPYADNPYDDSDRIQNEAYNDLRPEVKTYLTDAQMAKYDIIFVGTPCWWHQPAMVVCTFLEHYDLSDKLIIPFVTYGATTYLNETMQKLYKCTPDSRHIPAELPEDLDPDNIRQPQNDDAGIDMPTARTVSQWLERIGYGKENSGVSGIPSAPSADYKAVYSLSGTRLPDIPDSGIYIQGGRRYVAR